MWWWLQQYKITYCLHEFFFYNHDVTFSAYEKRKFERFPLGHVSCWALVCLDVASVPESLKCDGKRLTDFLHFLQYFWTCAYCEAVFGTLQTPRLAQSICLLCEGWCAQNLILGLADDINDDSFFKPVFPLGCLKGQNSSSGIAACYGSLNIHGSLNWCSGGGGNCWKKLGILSFMDGRCIVALPQQTVVLLFSAYHK